MKLDTHTVTCNGFGNKDRKIDPGFLKFNIFGTLLGFLALPRSYIEEVESSVFVGSDQDSALVTVGWSLYKSLNHRFFSLKTGMIFMKVFFYSLKGSNGGNDFFQETGEPFVKGDGAVTVLVNGLELVFAAASPPLKAILL